MRPKVKLGFTVYFLSVLLVVFCFSSFALTEKQAGQIEKVLGQKMGINDSLYEVSIAEHDGEEIILATIILNGETIQGFSDENIRETLYEYEEKNAFYISILTSKPEAAFNPYDLIVKQESDSWAVVSAMDLTEGFKQGQAKKELGNGKWASRGIVVFPDAVDKSSPLSLKFGNTSQKMNQISPSVKEAKKEECGACNKEEAQKVTEEKTEMEQKTTGEKGRDKESNANEGAALGLNGVLLALLTLSFL